MRVASRSVAQRFDDAWSDYEGQWLRYDHGLNRPSERLGFSAVREYYESVNVVKASEDKTFPGAIAAGLASPWGQAIPAGNLTNGEPTYFGSYREVFARDLYEAFAGLLVAGDIRTAQDATRFLFERQQQPDGSMPRNSLENGKVAPDTGGLQLDETSYPILMDWQSGLAHDSALYQSHVIPAADFLVAHGPSDGVERWEEQSGFSPSTIAAEIAGLTAAAHIATVNHDPVRADVYQATADDFARNIKTWTVTIDGPYAPSYFIRLSKSGDPNAADAYTLNNGNTTNEPQQNIVDAGFLELVRLGVLPASDPDVQASVRVVDDVIERQTPSGPGFYRYGFSNPANLSEDGYGDCFDPAPPPQGPNQDPTSCFPTGKPWPSNNPGTNNGNIGTGHLWPVLSGERGEYEVAAGDSQPRPVDAELDAEHDLRPGPRARAGLGEPGDVPGLQVRHRSDDRLDRVHRRQAGRVGQPAHLGPVAVRPSGAGPERGAQPRNAWHRQPALRRPRDAGFADREHHLAGQRCERRAARPCR